ncbi:uncharacterized protein ACIB01_002321 [Guaruba guarouba]
MALCSLPGAPGAAAGRFQRPLAPSPPPAAGHRAGPGAVRRGGAVAGRGRGGAARRGRGAARPDPTGEGGGEGRGGGGAKGRRRETEQRLRVPAPQLRAGRSGPAAAPPSRQGAGRPPPSRAGRAGGRAWRGGAGRPPPPQRPLSHRRHHRARAAAHRRGPPRPACTGPAGPAQSSTPRRGEGARGRGGCPGMGLSQGATAPPVGSDGNQEQQFTVKNQRDQEAATVAGFM